MIRYVLVFRSPLLQKRESQFHKYIVTTLHPGNPQNSRITFHFLNSILHLFAKKVQL